MIRQQLDLRSVNATQDDWPAATEGSRGQLTRYLDSSDCSDFHIVTIPLQTRILPPSPCLETTHSVIRLKEPHGHGNQLQLCLPMRHSGLVGETLHWFYAAQRQIDTG